MFYKCVKIVVVILVLLGIGVIGVRVVKPDLYNAWKAKAQSQWDRCFKTHHMRDDGIL